MDLNVHTISTQRSCDMGCGSAAAGVFTGGGSSIAEAATGTKIPDSINSRALQTAASFGSSGLADIIAGSREGTAAGGFDRAIDIGGNVDWGLRTGGQQLSPGQRRTAGMVSNIVGGVLGGMYSPVLAAGGTAIGGKIMGQSDTRIGQNALSSMGASALTRGIAPVGRYVSGAVGGGVPGGVAGGATTGSIAGGTSAMVRGQNVGQGATMGGITGGISGGLSAGTNGLTGSAALDRGLATSGSLAANYLINRPPQPSGVQLTPVTPASNALTRSTRTGDGLDYENRLIPLPAYGQYIGGYYGR